MRARVPASATPRSRRWRALGVASIAGLVLTACGDEKQDVFTPDGQRAREINDLQVPVFLIAGVVGLLVAAAMAYVIILGRRRAKTDAADPVQLEGNFKLEIGWTIAPAVLLGIIAVFTVGTLLRLDDAEALPPELEGMEITVYGHQWWWGYEYELGDGDDTPEIITANDLVIPAGVPVTLNIRSRDVIHSFWIPGLNGTRDAVPGRTHTLVIEADEPGEYDGQCKEFCGLSHANMKARVVAVTMSEFESWLQQQQQTQPMLAAGDPGFEGQQIFIAQCTRCHQINGLENADGDPIEVEGVAALVAGHAPNLTHLMTREVYAGALFDLYDPETGEFDRAQLEAWLRNAPEQKPMYAEPAEGELARGMPALGLTEADIDRLIDYLVTLGPQPLNPAGPTPSAPTTDEAGS
ncbi:MAG TPA: cytochrome c oxidase subunit II [Acidimicrobiales bacterium]|nr:cytochrome c oxidase subunit II [Acidimicrobiales bacterium]